MKIIKIIASYFLVLLCFYAAVTLAGNINLVGDWNILEKAQSGQSFDSGITKIRRVDDFFDEHFTRDFLARETKLPKDIKLYYFKETLLESPFGVINFLGVSEHEKLLYLFELNITYYEKEKWYFITAPTRAVYKIKKLTNNHIIATQDRIKMTITRNM